MYRTPQVAFLLQQQQKKCEILRRLSGKYLTKKKPEVDNFCLAINISVHYLIWKLSRFLMNIHYLV